jgi:hypothetical protein
MADGAVRLATIIVQMQNMTLTSHHRVCGMVANTAKSRSAANQNMANRLVQLEQAHHLRYVLPTDPFHEAYTADGQGEQLRDDSSPTHSLVQGLINNLEITDKQHSTIAADQCPSFTAPARSHTLTESERHCLARDILHVSGQALGTRNIPTTCIRWAGALLQNTSTQKIFRVVSMQMRRSDSKRSNALVRFQHHKPESLDIISSFGRVEFFFELPACAEYPNGIQVAYMRTLHVVQDGRLVYIVREGAMQMATLQSIKELMGLFIWNGNQYLLNSITSLLL